MPVGVSFQVPESLAIRTQAVKKYKEHIINIRKDNTIKNKWEQLQELRAQFIEHYMKVSERVTPYEMIMLADSVFFEFDWRDIQFPDLLEARADVLKQLKKSENYTKNKEAISAVFGDEDLNSEKLSYFDSMLINKVRTRREMIDNVEKLCDEYGDTYFYYDLTKVRDQIKNSIKLSNKTTNYKNYWYKICSLAADFSENKDSYFDKSIKKNLSETKESLIAPLPSTQMPDQQKPLYLDMRYEESSTRTSVTHYYDAPSSVKKSTTTYVKALNPEYVQKNLPEGVTLKKDKKGYYFEQKSKQIKQEALERIGKNYSPENELTMEKK